MSKCCSDLRRQETLKSRLTSLYHQSVISLKQIFYQDRGEPVDYGEHKLRYIPGTRPVRLKYIDSKIGTVRNDAKQTKYFLDNVKPGEFVLDIGGNVGQYAVFFASLVRPSGKVITFEPDETSREVMKRNLALNGFSNRVIVEDLALFDKAGTCEFFSKGGGDATASLARSGLGTDISKTQLLTQNVRTERLDDYLLAKRLDNPNWIKLDTEGAEINILRGGLNTLKSDTKIICELHPYAWEEFGTTYEELLDIVKNCGRSIRYLDDLLKIEDGAYYGATIIS